MVRTFHKQCQLPSWNLRSPTKTQYSFCLFSLQVSQRPPWTSSKRFRKRRLNTPYVNISINTYMRVLIGSNDALLSWWCPRSAALNATTSSFISQHLITRLKNARCFNCLSQNLLRVHSKNIFERTWFSSSHQFEFLELLFSLMTENVRNVCGYFVYFHAPSLSTKRRQ